ncbi:hypothetical protein BGP78_21100 [Pseudoalteromonas sp. MSK9-3]|nr:hypothetical protein BGP78_21100 [Pseudoalteromonas sp. MSK9-3]
MHQLLLMLGIIFSTLMHKPSKFFSCFICLNLVGLAAVLSSFYSPIFHIIPSFVTEWWTQGTYENFPMYLVLASYSLLIFAFICQVKALAFECAVYIKNNFNKNMPLL